MRTVDNVPVAWDCSNDSVGRELAQWAAVLSYRVEKGEESNSYTEACPDVSIDQVQLVLSRVECTTWRLLLVVLCFTQ